MTVCIAAISTENEIIVAVDRKASSTEYSNEDATTKSAWVAPGWLCLFAGEDIAPVMPIVRRASKKLAEILPSREDEEERFSLEEVTQAMESGYQEFLSDICRAKVLSRWDFKTIKEFREHGRKQFGADEFDRMCMRIDEMRLKVTFLVCGIDEDGAPHIFTVSNPGVVEVRDEPGYWAIGNGGPAAMSLMSYFRQSIIKTLPETIYNVFAAKLMAQSASDVGENSFLWRLTKDGWDQGFPAFEHFQLVDKAWNEGGKPYVPRDALDEIKELLKNPLSDSQTSKD